jgi:hypothetical protein
MNYRLSLLFAVSVAFPLVLLYLRETAAATVEVVTPVAGTPEGAVRAAATLAAEAPPVILLVTL